MAIILSGVTLSPDMIWEDEIGSQEAVAQTNKRTLGGASIIQFQQLFEGRPITLTADQGQGWLTKQQVLDVQDLARQAGNVLSLTIGASTYPVMFRHEDAPAFEATALNQIGAQAPDGYYTATIKLITI